MVQGAIKKTLSPTPLQLVAMISRITGSLEDWIIITENKEVESSHCIHDYMYRV